MYSDDVLSTTKVTQFHPDWLEGLYQDILGLYIVVDQVVYVVQILDGAEALSGYRL